MATYTYPRSLIENAPRTNVGIVNIGGGRKHDMLVAPRDPRAKNLLGYGPIEYNLPEELEFSEFNTAEYGPQDWTGGGGIVPFPRGYEEGVYNTELNPFDPSSQFFPYEPDYAGIMSARAYEDVGEPMGMDAKQQAQYQGFGKEFYDHEGNLVTSPEEGQYMYDEKGEPIMQDNYGLYYDNQINVSPAMHSIGPPQLGYQDPEEQRDTVFHEGKHFFIDQYGQLVPKTSALDDEHNPIYFADMWRKDPGYENMTLGKEDALAFMEMQNLGRKVVQGKYDLPESRKQTWNRRFKELISDPGLEGMTSIEDPIMQQRLNQFEAMYDPRRGDYTRPTMSQGEMARDARMTGGGVNPHEATRAGYTGRLGRPNPLPTSYQLPERSQSRGRPNPHQDFNTGGLASLVL